MLTLGKNYDMYDLKQANFQADQLFFSYETMRFFNSRVSERVERGFDGWYFVTSEKYDWNTPRLYTIRKMTPDAHVHTVGQHSAYNTGQQAWREVTKILKQEQQPTLPLEA